jgi:alkanesulfonate monooxygenase SsuD/methylene tetrahydromethanopterin reductase-like flavin-dependent oxidoreductase (luciferase family)
MTQDSTAQDTSPRDTAAASGAVRPEVHPWVRDAQQRPRFAIVGTFLPEWAQVRDFAVRAEELGFDAYWANDHPLRSMDCWTQLAALATVTTRLRLIALVSCVYYRSPALIARQAADVDRISGGRLVLGLGTGDDAAEFGQLGLRFPAAPERLAALAEAAGIIRAMWAGPVTHAGPHFQVTDAHVRPGPVQQPGVPVLIGGGGERTTLRLVARYADVSNFGPHEWTGGAYDLAAVRRKYELLRGYCEEIGRPYDAILRSHYTPLLTLAESPRELESKRSRARIPDAGLRTVPVFATVGEAIVHYQGLIDAGVHYFLATVNGRDAQTAELLAGQVLPALRPAGGPAQAARPAPAQQDLSGPSRPSSS